MDSNQNLRAGVRRFSQNRCGQELLKVSDAFLQNFEDFSHLNNQIPQQGKDINFLSAYYNKKESNRNFIEKISQLNKKFYNCSNKYIKAKKTVEKLNDDLYLNLFKQIDCYAEEIERLNKKIYLNNNQELKNNIELLNKDITEKKEKIRDYENKLREKTNNEDKLKKEIESYKRKLIFYKDKIKIGLLVRNRNTLDSLERKNGYNRKERKNHHNSISPEQKKIIPLGNKDKKIEGKTNNIIDENEDKTNNLESLGKIKKVNKKFKTKESVFKLDRDSNYFINKTEYDEYDKDLEEKENESENDFDFIRGIERSKTIKEIPILEKKELPEEEHSQKFSSGLLNSLTKELYGPPENNDKNNIVNDSNTNSVYLNNNNCSKIGMENKENIEYEKTEKSKTLNKDSRGKKIVNKFKKIDNLSNNINKKENIKTKVFNNNNRKLNKTLEKNINNIKNNQAKTSTKSKIKNEYKSTDKTSNLSEVHTPYIKKYKQHFNKENEKNIPISIKTQSSTDSTPSIKYNSNSSTQNNKNINSFKKIEVNKINNKTNKIIERDNAFIKKNKKLDSNDKKDGHNSMSNLNIINKFNNTSSKNFTNKKSNERVNEKELSSILKDVNDDYLKSIEMLRKQEEQIKYMLSFIDLDEK